MSLATNLQNAFTRVATEFKAVRVLISGSGTGDTQGLTTASKNLVGAVNEVKGLVGAGSPSTLDDLTDVVIAAPATGQLLRYNAATSHWENVLGTTYYEVAGAAAAAQAASQPLDGDLSAIAALSTTAFGRNLLALADAAAGRASLGLAAVASSGSASDITTGTLPTSVLPPLAINDTFVVATQAAMLALAAQRGDVAVRTDLGRTFILATDSPGTLADWKQITAQGDVVSVAGRVGAVVLTKADVGLSNLDNIQQQPLDADLTAIAALASAADKLPYATGASTWSLTTLTAAARTLLDDPDVATMRATLQVYSQTEIGDPTTDFVATFNAGLL